MINAMKGFLFCAMSLLVLALTGCVSERNRLVLDSVGPAHASAPQPTSEGFLTVYSAYDQGAHFYSRDYEGREYSDYSILEANGQPLREVHNSTDTIMDSPATVSLPPGQYKVIARANGYGNVTVPVTIERNRQTIVHLEGGETTPELAGADPDKMVRLPDGRIVGFKSNL